MESERLFKRDLINTLLCFYGIPKVAYNNWSDYIHKTEELIKMIAQTTHLTVAELNLMIETEVERNVNN